ncbi:hypothetical protein HanIR_Chr06g0266271 [Helianthus annuus]|nr:hypothetical protein HanIR_Chr06g0266271 [Helianthus annuus]
MKPAIENEQRYISRVSKSSKLAYIIKSSVPVSISQPRDLYCHKISIFMFSRL